MSDINLALGLCLMTPEKVFLRSLLQTAANIFATKCFKYFGWSIVQGALLPYSRNEVIRSIYVEQPEFTHLLFIDDDMCNFDIAHIGKLISNDKPICSALVTFRRYPYDMVFDIGTSKLDDITNHLDKKSVVESRYVGMAFTVIKREVLDAVKEETEGGPVWFTMDRPQRKTFEQEAIEFVQHNGDVYNIENVKCEDDISKQRLVERLLKEAITFGQSSHIGSQLRGEDTAFCERAKLQGFDSYVDFGVPVGHLGNTVYDYRYTLQNAIMQQQQQTAKEQPELKIVTP